MCRRGDVEDLRIVAANATYRHTLIEAQAARDRRRRGHTLRKDDGLDALDFD